MDEKDKPNPSGKAAGRESAEEKKRRAANLAAELADEDMDADPDDEPVPEPEAPPFTPIQGWRTWAILGAIFVVIAVAVLYVYQTGDNKTVLGNQPIPAGQGYVMSAPVALNAPLVDTPPLASPPAPSFPAIAGQPTGAASQLQCPRDGTTGLPVCASCGAIMQPLNQGAAGSGLYVCPACGAVGVPLCPHCGAHMIEQGQATLAVR